MVIGDLSPRVADWADQVRSIAQIGLHFSEATYDRERYERLLGIAADMAAALTGVPAATLSADWSVSNSYVTPKVGVAAVIYDDAGRVLLLRRPDNGLWALPGGWADCGSTAASNVVREVREEVGLTVRVDRLLGVYDSRANQSTHLYHFYDLVFVCGIVAGVPSTSPEALDVGFFGSAELPDITPPHRRPVADALASYAKVDQAALFER